MIKKNILPENAELSYDSSKNETIYRIGYFLHPSDVDSLFEIIDEFVNNKSQISRDFSISFNELINKESGE